MGVFDAFQIPYSALQREHEDVIERRRPAPASSSGAAWPGRAHQGKHEGVRDRWEQAHLDDLLDGMTQAFMLRFTFSHPDLDTTIVGTATWTTSTTTSPPPQGPLPTTSTPRPSAASAAGSTPSARVGASIGAAHPVGRAPQRQRPRRSSSSRRPSGQGP